MNEWKKMLRGRYEAGPYFIVILQQPPRPKNVFAYAATKGKSLVKALDDRELGIYQDQPWSPPAVEDVVNEIKRINPNCKVLRGGYEYRKFDPIFNRDMRSRATFPDSFTVVKDGKDVIKQMKKPVNFAIAVPTVAKNDVKSYLDSTYPWYKVWPKISESENGFPDDYDTNAKFWV